MLVDLVYSKMLVAIMVSLTLRAYLSKVRGYLGAFVIPNIENVGGSTT
jgi:hypothetical protein